MGADDKSLEPFFNNEVSEAEGLYRVLRMKSVLNPIEGYHISDQETGATSYFGYVNKDGKYYIQRGIRTGAVVNYTYSSGSSGYATAWAANSTETYQNFADEF